eukprot:c22094_g1_i1 orf=344-973(+)
MLAMDSETHEDRPLRAIGQAFVKLASALDVEGSELEVASFSRACSQVSVLFGHLGIAFKFAEKDYVAKVKDLSMASKDIATLQSLLEHDFKSNSVKHAGSHSRNLLRVKRGLDMVRVLFHKILITDDNSLRDCASMAYQQVFSPYHSFPIRTAVRAGLYTLPTRVQLLKKLKEDENSARVPMHDYVTAVDPVIKYVENLFISRDLGIDW